MSHFLDSLGSAAAGDAASPNASATAPTADVTVVAEQAVAATRRGQACAWTGDWAGADAAFRASVALREQLVRAEAAGAAVTARGWHELAVARLAFGDTSEAHALLERARAAVAVAEGGAELDPLRAAIGEAWARVAPDERSAVSGGAHAQAAHVATIEAYAMAARAEAEQAADAADALARATAPVEHEPWTTGATAAASGRVEGLLDSWATEAPAAGAPTPEVAEVPSRQAPGGASWPAMPAAPAPTGGGLAFLEVDGDVAPPWTAAAPLAAPEVTFLEDVGAPPPRSTPRLFDPHPVARSPLAPGRDAAAKGAPAWVAPLPPDDDEVEFLSPTSEVGERGAGGAGAPPAEAALAGAARPRATVVLPEFPAEAPSASTGLLARLRRLTGR